MRQALIALARDRVVTLEITVSSFSSYVAFLEGYTRALAALDTRTGRARSWLRDMFSGAKPELRVDADGPGLSVAFPSVRTARDAARLAEEVFVLPSRIAARLKRRLAIAFDEFQAIGSFNGGSVEQALRAAVQQQRQVGYVFAGSEPTLMEQMIGPRRPVLQSRAGHAAGQDSRRTSLRPSSRIASRARASRRRPDSARPSSTWPATCPTTSSASPTRPGTTCSAAAGGRAGARRSPRRRSTGCSPSTKRSSRRSGSGSPSAQRGVLRAVVIEHGVEILSGDTRSRHRLGVASSVQAALGALVKQDIIAREDDGRYVVIDSLMREWVARRTY